MPGEKKTILLDYNGPIELITTKLIEEAAKQFRLVLPNGVLALMEREHSIWYETLSKLCAEKKIEVDATDLQVGTNEHDFVQTICNILRAYYAQNKNVDYVLVGTSFTHGMAKLAKAMRKNGGVVISPHELALLLYHEGKLESKFLNSIREPLCE